MSSDKNTTEITILDRKYLIACPKEEQAALLRSASYLNQKMQEIKRTGKVLSLERLAIMAALNITHEMLGRNESEQNNSAQLQRLDRQLDQALEKFDHLVEARKLS
ncbi:cell division protein ZapA [Marinospirillum sp.]|uniref:cell division protein ZapA n=1 Tax=Marinospirillum sp. TaxID=2183934 RepID=UPI003A8C7124